MGVTEQVRAVCEPIAADLGLDVFDVEHAGGTVAVVLDRHGGIGIDDITTATRLISRALDEQDPLPGRYTLEVSSPGLERALRTPDHFRWAVGRDVAVRTRPPVGESAADQDTPRRVAGVLTAADDEGITVTPEGEGSRTIPYDRVDRARTTFEWGPQPKPGKGKPGKDKPGKGKANRSSGGSRATKQEQERG